MTTLGEHLDRYLSVRRALGYKLDEHGRLLGSFVASVDASGQQTVTAAGALAWAGGARTDAQAARRLSMVRGFAAYMAAFDTATEVPARNLGPGHAHRGRPYLFTDGQVADLLGAARRLEPTVWASSVATMIGLLAATGIRPGEAYRLRRGDVDLTEGQIEVMHSKFGKSRRLPLHPTTVDALARHAAVRDDAVGDAHDAFFVTATRKPVARSGAAAVFRSLRGAAGIVVPPGQRPARLYDLRHTFAVSTLLGWHRDGRDAQQLLPVLSAYLGHAKPDNTYWYLEASPELMAVAARRYTRSWEQQP